MYNASFASLAGAFAIINSALSLSAGLVPSPTLRPEAEVTTPRLIQYVQTFNPHYNENGHLSLLPLIERNTGITHIVLAALHINGPHGNITLNDDSPNSTYFDQTWAEAETLQRHDVKVMVMIGGAAHGSYNGALCNSEDGSVQDEYYLPLVSTLKYHRVDGVDLDIEEVVPTSCPQNLVHRIRDDFRDDFIITMAPVASALASDCGSMGGFSYKDFDRSTAGPLVDWYNGQYYNGFVEGSIEYSYEMAVRNGFSPRRVVVGVLGSDNDGGGFVDIGHIEELIANLREEYSDFGGIDGWEYFDSGISDGLSRPWMWVKQIGRALFGPSSESAITRRSRQEHRPPLPTGVVQLMSEGHDQIDAAKAMRLGKGDVEAGRQILTKDL